MIFFSFFDLHNSFSYQIFDNHGQKCQSLRSVRNHLSMMVLNQPLLVLSGKKELWKPHPHVEGDNFQITLKPCQTKELTKSLNPLCCPRTVSQESCCLQERSHCCFWVLALPGGSFALASVTQPCFGARKSVNLIFSPWIMAWQPYKEGETQTCFASEREYHK